MNKVCECCGKSFELVIGRGVNNRITCYTCTTGNKKLTYRNKHLKRKYGITQFQFTELLRSQDNKCGVCEVELTTDNHALSSGAKRLGNEACVDHNHNTGEVRGILCFHCNTALGHIFDNIKTVDKIKEYLNANSLFQRSLSWL